MRSTAVVAAARQARRQKLPRDVVVLLVVLGLLVVGGLAALFIPYRPTRALRLLGTLDQPRPTATPARR